jgi:hypothetical protein
VSSVFPGAIDDFDTSMLPGGPMSVPSHAAQHQKIGDALEKIEATLGFGRPDAEVATPTAVGAASLSVTRGAPSAIFNNRLVQLGIGTPSNFEARQVISLSGSTFALGNALNFAHAAGEPIYWLKDATVTPWHYGANGQPGVLDDGPQLQRMFLDASVLAIPVGGLSGLRIYGGGGPVADGTVPLYIPGSLIEELFLHIGNGVGAAPFQVGQYAVRTCRDTGQVVATGSHRLTIQGGLNADDAKVFVDHKISFTDACTPAGSFPTGIIPGHVYGVKATAGNGGSWFTIYDWDDVTKAEVAVGTGGSGWYFTSMDNQAHHNWKHVRIHAYGVGQNGVSLACQQQSSFQSLYLEHGTNQTTNRGATMLAVQGQGGRFDDLTVRVLEKTIGVAYNGSTLQKFSTYFSVIAEYGTGDTTPAVTVTDSFHLKWDGHWFESRGIIEISGNCSTLDFGTPYLGGTQINDLTTNASWQMGMAKSSNSSSDIVYSHDGFRAFTINGGTGGNGDADGGGAFFGIIKPSSRPPVFPYRTTRSGVGSGPLSIWNQIVLVNGPAALTIPQSAIIEGVDWIIKRQNTTGNVTVTPASPATVTDAAGTVSSALTITTSAAVHIVCSGGNIYVI